MLCNAILYAFLVSGIAVCCSCTVRQCVAACCSVLRCVGQVDYVLSHVLWKSIFPGRSVRGKPRPKRGGVKCMRLRVEKMAISRHGFGRECLLGFYGELFLI